MESSILIFFCFVSSFSFQFFFLFLFLVQHVFFPLRKSIPYILHSVMFYIDFYGSVSTDLVIQMGLPLHQPIRQYPAQCSRSFSVLIRWWNLPRVTHTHSSWHTRTHTHKHAHTHSTRRNLFLSSQEMIRMALTQCCILALCFPFSFAHKKKMIACYDNFQDWLLPLCTSPLVNWHLRAAGVVVGVTPV